MIKIDVMAEIAKALQSIEKFQKEAVKSLQSMAAQGQSAFNTLGKAVVVLNQGLELAGKGYRVLSATVSAGIKASIESEEATNNLNQALKAAGQSSQQTSKDIQAYASKLQEMTTFDDEAILGAATLGIQLGKLSGQQLKDATLAAANLSSALGIDLNSAMTKIVKSSIDGGAGLKRYGIEVEKGATKSITLGNAIAKVNEQFAGTAESKVQTYKGAIGQAANAYGNLLEKIGDFVTKNPVLIKIINIVSKAFQSLEKVIGELDPSPITRLVTDGIVFVIDGLILLTKAINPVITGFSLIYKVGSTVFKGIETAVAAVTATFATFISTVVSGYTGLFNLIPKRFVPEGWQESLNQFNESVNMMAEATVETTSELATETGQSFAEIGTAFVDTFSEEKLALITNVLKKTQDEIKKAATAAIVLKNTVVANEKAQNKAILSELDLFYAAWKEKLTKFKKYEELSAEERVQGTRDALGQISTLTSSSNRKLFEIGKAAAITTATVDGILAVQKTLAATPYPVNFVLAALVGTAAAVNVAKIASTPIPKFAEGGIVPGNNFIGDSVTARVNSGEMILNREQQSKLFQQINQGGNSKMDQVLELLQREIVVRTSVELDQRTFANILVSLNRNNQRVTA